MPAWNALLLVYEALDLRLSRRRFRHVLGERDVGEAVRSFDRFPALAAEVSGGEALVRHEVVRAGRPLNSLTGMGPDQHWPSPEDTRPELDRWAPPGAYDSVFVLWPLEDPATGESVPSGGWGLAVGATDWANGATYATVGSARPEVWAVPVRGEVWLHEWLHGVCDVYARRGFPMPPGDADGAERNGYRRDPADGWCAYYRDLTRGLVLVGGRPHGIPADAWRGGAVRPSGGA
jgi:hypothetical protein